MSIEDVKKAPQNVEDVAPVEGLAPPEKSNGKLAVARKKTTKIGVNEMDVAKAFTAKYGNTMLFDQDTGKWFEWQGDHWEQHGGNHAFHYCGLLCEEASNDLKPGSGKHTSMRSARFASGVEKYVKRSPAHAVRQNAWDTDPMLLGCPGVTVDLRTGEARTPDPKDRITKLTAAAPAAKADCPLWLNFLDQTTNSDQGMITFLQHLCGYCLTGLTTEQSLFFIYGSGGNGKSVFTNVLTGIFNNYMVTAAMGAFNKSKFDKHPTDLAMMRGARLVTASETSSGRAFDEVRLKTVTGGEPITARFMRQDEFTYVPQLKLIVVGLVAWMSFCQMLFLFTGMRRLFDAP